MSLNSKKSVSTTAIGNSSSIGSSGIAAGISSVKSPASKNKESISTKTQQQQQQQHQQSSSTAETVHNSDDGAGGIIEDEKEALIKRAVEERKELFRRYELGREADIDPWEDPSYEVYFITDRYGFLHDQRLPQHKPNEDKARVLEMERVKKWLKMLLKWNDRKTNELLHRRIFKGIPDKLRSPIWLKLLNIENTMNANKNVYQKMLELAREWAIEARQIDSDVNRQFRDNLFFRDRYGIKQHSLFNVLTAYSMYNMEVGYCQGMSGVAAVLLMYMNEEEAFWALSVLFSDKKYAMHGFYIHGFPKLQRFIAHHDKIITKFIPKLKKKFDEFHLDAILYSLKWFFVIFIERIPFSLCLRVWDIYLLLGERVVTAMAFTILRLHKNKLLEMKEMDSILQYLQVTLCGDFGYSDDYAIEKLVQSMEDLRKVKMELPPVAADNEFPQKPFGTFIEPNFEAKVGIRKHTFTDTEKNVTENIIKRNEVTAQEVADAKLANGGQMMNEVDQLNTVKFSMERMQLTKDILSSNHINIKMHETPNDLMEFWNSISPSLVHGNVPDSEDGGSLLGSSRKSLADTSVTSTADLSVFSMGQRSQHAYDICVEDTRSVLSEIDDDREGERGEEEESSQGSAFGSLSVVGGSSSGMVITPTPRAISPRDIVRIYVPAAPTPQPQPTATAVPGSIEITTTTMNKITPKSPTSPSTTTTSTSQASQLPEQISPQTPSSASQPSQKGQYQEQLITKGYLSSSKISLNSEGGIIFDTTTAGIDSNNVTATNTDNDRISVLSSDIEINHFSITNDNDDEYDVHNSSNVNNSDLELRDNHNGSRINSNVNYIHYKNIFHSSDNINDIYIHQDINTHAGVDGDDDDDDVQRISSSSLARGNLGKKSTLSSSSTSLIIIESTYEPPIIMECNHMTNQNNTTKTITKTTTGTGTTKTKTTSPLNSPQISQSQLKNDINVRQQIGYPAPTPPPQLLQKSTHSRHIRQQIGLPAPPPLPPQSPSSLSSKPTMIDSSATDLLNKKQTYITECNIQYKSLGMNDHWESIKDDDLNNKSKSEITTNARPTTASKQSKKYDEDDHHRKLQPSLTNINNQNNYIEKSYKKYGHQRRDGHLRQRRRPDDKTNDGHNDDEDNDADDDDDEDDEDNDEDDYGDRGDDDRFYNEFHKNKIIKNHRQITGKLYSRFVSNMDDDDYDDDDEDYKKMINNKKNISDESSSSPNSKSLQNTPVNEKLPLIPSLINTITPTPTPSSSLTSTIVTSTTTTTSINTKKQIDERDDKEIDDNNDDDEKNRYGSYEKFNIYYTTSRDFSQQNSEKPKQLSPGIAKRPSRIPLFSSDGAGTSHSGDQSENNNSNYYKKINVNSNNSTGSNNRNLKQSSSSMMVIKSDNSCAIQCTPAAHTPLSHPSSDHQYQSHHRHNNTNNNNHHHRQNSPNSSTHNYQQQNSTPHHNQRHHHHPSASSSSPSQSCDPYEFIQSNNNNNKSRSNIQQYDQQKQQTTTISATRNANDRNKIRIQITPNQRN